MLQMNIINIIIIIIIVIIIFAFHGLVFVHLCVYVCKFYPFFSFFLSFSWIFRIGSHYVALNVLQLTL